MQQGRNKTVKKCPTCGKHTGSLNIGRYRWNYCQQHKIKWFAGSAFTFQSPRNAAATWEANREKLEGYSLAYPELLPTELKERAT